MVRVTLLKFIGIAAKSPDEKTCPLQLVRVGQLLKFTGTEPRGVAGMLLPLELTW